MSALEERIANALEVRPLDVAVTRDGVYLTGYGRILRLYGELTDEDEGEVTSTIEAIRKAVDEADAVGRGTRRAEP